MRGLGRSTSECVHMCVFCLVGGGQQTRFVHVSVCSNVCPGSGVGIMLHTGLLTCTWSCVSCSELSVCTQVVSLTQSLASGEHSLLRGAPPWESVQSVAPWWRGTPTDSDLGLPTQDFDRLFEVLRGALTKDSGSGFVFSCLSGQGRTTTAMVVAVLAFWHVRVREASVRAAVRPGSMGTGCLGTLAVPGGCRGRADAWRAHPSWAEGSGAGRPLA